MRRLPHFSKARCESRRGDDEARLHHGYTAGQMKSMMPTAPSPAISSTSAIQNSFSARLISPAVTSRLPSLAPRLPFPIPVPVWFGRPDASYKWPFLGYRRLDGRVASDVDLSGAADPSRMDQHEQESAATVGQKQGEADQATTADFGENSIAPDVDPETLRSRYRPAAPKGSARRGRHAPTSDVFDSIVGPSVREQVQAENQKYDEAKSQHQIDSAELREESSRRIAEEDSRTRREQLAMRQQAREQVDGARQEWRATNARVAQDFNDGAQAKRREADKQIDTKVAEAESQADAELTKAETESEKEKAEAERKAAEEKSKAEEKPRSWWERFKGAVSSAFDAIRDAVNGIFEAARAKVRQLIQAAKVLCQLDLTQGQSVHEP